MQDVTAAGRSLVEMKGSFVPPGDVGCVLGQKEKEMQPPQEVWPRAEQMYRFVPLSPYFASGFTWEGIFNYVTQKSDRGRMYQGEIAQAGDSIWPPQHNTHIGTLHDDQARVTRAEGTSATVGSAHLEEPAQEQWGN